VSVRWIGGATAVLVGAALLALPWWPDAPQTANRKLEDRLDAVERKLSKADERSRSNEAQIVSSDVVMSEIMRKLGRIEPENTAVIELRGGGGNKWVLNSGAEATVKYVGLAEGDGVTLKIKHKTLDADFVLRPGESVRAVDDRGTERRVYTTTLHSIERDRTGAPRRARVSVDYGIESGL